MRKISILMLVLCSFMAAEVFAGKGKSDNAPEFEHDNRDNEHSNRDNEHSNRDHNSGKNNKKDMSNLSDDLEKVGYFDYYISQCNLSNTDAKSDLEDVLEYIMSQAKESNSKKFNSLALELINSGKSKARKVRNDKGLTIYCDHNYMLQIKFRAFIKEYGV